jgi:hypothetical protein
VHQELFKNGVRTLIGAKLKKISKQSYWQVFSLVVVVVVIAQLIRVVLAQEETL